MKRHPSAMIVPFYPVQELCDLVQMPFELSEQILARKALLIQFATYVKSRGVWDGLAKGVV